MSHVAPRFALHRRQHQFAGNRGTTRALRRSGKPMTAARRVSIAAAPVAFIIPNLIPNPSYRWGELARRTGSHQH